MRGGILLLLFLFISGMFISKFIVSSQELVYHKRYPNFWIFTISLFKDYLIVSGYNYTSRYNEVWVANKTTGDPIFKLWTSLSPGGTQPKITYHVSINNYLILMGDGLYIYDKNFTLVKMYNYTEVKVPLLYGIYRPFDIDPINNRVFIEYENTSYSGIFLGELNLSNLELVPKKKLPSWYKAIDYYNGTIYALWTDSYYYYIEKINTTNYSIEKQLKLPYEYLYIGIIYDYVKNRVYLTRLNVSKSPPTLIIEVYDNNLTKLYEKEIGSISTSASEHRGFEVYPTKNGTYLIIGIDPANTYIVNESLDILFKKDDTPYFGFYSIEPGYWYYNTYHYIYKYNLTILGEYIPEYQVKYPQPTPPEEEHTLTSSPEGIAPTKPKVEEKPVTNVTTNVTYPGVQAVVPWYKQPWLVILVITLVAFIIMRTKRK